MLGNIPDRITDRYFSKTQEGRSDIIKPTLPLDLGTVGFISLTSSVLLSEVLTAPGVVSKSFFAAGLVLEGLAGTAYAMRELGPQAVVKQKNQETL
jgi:hypothetical protein